MLHVEETAWENAAEQQEHKYPSWNSSDNVQNSLKPNEEKHSREMQKLKHEYANMEVIENLKTY